MRRGTPPPASPAFTFPSSGERFTLDALERSMLEQSLALCDGHQVNAASLLGLTRYQLRYRCRKHGVKLQTYAPRRVTPMDVLRAAAAEVV